MTLPRYVTVISDVMYGQNIRMLEMCQNEVPLTVIENQVPLNFTRTNIIMGFPVGTIYKHSFYTHIFHLINVIRMTVII